MSLLLLALAGACALLLAQYLLTGRRRAHLPPGPPSSYWTGVEIPREHPWRRLKEYTEQYGDLITIAQPGVGGRRRYLFVCGTAKSADAIMTKLGGATIDRPRQVMAGELASGGRRMLLMPYDERWRTYRRIMHEAVNSTAARQYEGIQEREARLTALQIGREPESFRAQFDRYAASVIMTLTYDHPIADVEDPLVVAVKERLGAVLKWLAPGASPLDKYAALRLLPTALNPWKREGERIHRAELALFLRVYNEVRERAKRNAARDCFALQLQERQAELGLTDEDACYIAGSFFGAGSDTTSSALAILVLALITHPAAMRKAQAELDAVVGAERLPIFADQAQLPYVRALCQEVMRWRPVSSGGFPHALTEDVQYNGYTLRKGDAVVANHWSISLDPDEYPDPDVFQPERFLTTTEEDKTTSSVKGTWFAPARGHIGFGFGRRICVGLNIAERSIFINAAILLWAFDFRAPGGKIDEVDTLAFTSAANSHPLPFQAEINYRSDKHRGVVEAEAATL